MHGCNGSIDGDSAAAMRYTEARLSKFSETMIELIDKNIVDFIPNFDGSENEPTFLPSMLPNLLINGSKGMAVGYATNIPTFNPTEVLNALIYIITHENPSLEKIMEFIPAPDFPTGGIILNKKGILSAFETGKGKIYIRSKIAQVNKKQAYITEIPFQVNKSDLIDEINDLAEKNDSLKIIECHDESDANGISICINFKNDVDFEFVKNFLFKKTSLQISFDINMIIINNRKPCLMSLIDILQTYIKNIDNIFLKSTEFDLKKFSERKHIVEAMILAINNIDKIIDLIRKTKNKKTAIIDLINNFNLTEIQAQTIVELQLYRLSSTDIEELNSELEKLNKQIEHATLIINDIDYRNKQIISILKTYKKEFGYERRSSISDEEEVVVKIDKIVEDREHVVLITKEGYIKNIIKKQYNNSELSSLKLKEHDFILNKFDINQRDKIIIITNIGNFITIPVVKIELSKMSDNFIHINSIVQLLDNEKIISIFQYNEQKNTTLIIASKLGMIKQVNINELGDSKIIKQSTVMDLKEKDEVISCIENIGYKYICSTTVSGKTLAYPINSISITGKNSSGVMNGGLKEEISCLTPITNKEFFIIVASEGIKKLKLKDIYFNKRTAIAKDTLYQSKSNSINILNTFNLDNSDNISLLTKDNKFENVSVNNIILGNISNKVFSYKHKTILFAKYNYSSSDIKEEIMLSKKSTIIDEL